MAASEGDGKYFTIISQLMAEKDRLITEKDELVVSKDRLWREMHQILQEKNGCTRGVGDQETDTNHLGEDQLENRRRHEEVSNLKRRNRELELALRSALDSDEDGEERPVDKECYVMLAELPCDELQKYETLDEDASEALQNVKTDNRYISMHQQLLTPSFQEPAFGSTERVTVDSRPPISWYFAP